MGTSIWFGLPYEKSRPNQEVYAPENLLNNRFISEYGGYTLERLWDGIVPFKGKDYFYVESDHVILRVIQKNWEMLGINTDAEVKRENQYVKVSSSVVNNVIKQLYEQVICQIPYTSFQDMSARQANDVPEGEYKVVWFLVQYKALRFKIPLLAANWIKSTLLQYNYTSKIVPNESNVNFLSVNTSLFFCFFV